MRRRALRGIAGPGFINIKLLDVFLARHVAAMSDDARLGCPGASDKRKDVIDYGGPNVAKPMHVGHLRSTIIGDSLKRISRFLGHDTVGDVHLGDWGLQMGMLIAERSIPVRPQVSAACEFLGLDPLYVANEGKLVAICPAADAERLLAAMRVHRHGRDAAIIGEVTDDPHRFVQMQTSCGGRRVV